MCNLKKIRNAVKAKVKDTQAGNGGLIKILQRGKGDLDLVFGKLTLNDKELAEATSIQHIFDIGVVVDMSFVKVEHIDTSKVKEITLDDVYSEYDFDVVVECINVVLAEMPVAYKVFDIGKGVIIHSKEWSVILLKGDVKDYEDIISIDDVKSKVH